jgi:dolichyl-phosphate-mannose-protein mannosyltransferase
MIAHDPTARREAIAVLVLTLIGAVLRFWSFGSLGLTHFDEGIYALSGLWSLSPAGLAAIDPMVIPYAPPGFPFLVGLSFGVLGVADVSAILVSAVCGVATIPVAAWVGRRTFGPGAGAAAAAFASVSMAHVALSRKALTDVPFVLAWLVAIGLGGRFLERPRLGRALALGLAVGAAQNLKYNGWLTGVIIIVAATLGALLSEDQRRRGALARTFGFGMLAALVAVAAYWPWFDFVQRHGGYDSLLRHHRSYTGGIASWYPHWTQQLAQVVALSGGPYWGLLTWGLAWFGAAWASTGARLVDPGTRWGWARFRLGLLGGAAVLALIANVAWWAGLLFTPRLLCDSRPPRRIVGVWWLILTLLTPFYHPYARLWLPMHAVGWLVLAGAVVSIGPFRREDGTTDLGPGRDVWSPPKRRFAYGIVILGLLLAGTQQRRSRAEPFEFARFFQSTSAFRDVVTALPNVLPSGSGPGPLLHVLARRPLAFYLLAQGRYRFQLLADSRQLKDLLQSAREAAGNETVVVVDDVQLGQDPLNTGGMGYFSFTLPGRVVLRSWEEVLDPITWLDVNPGAAMGSPLMGLCRTQVAKKSTSAVGPSGNGSGASSTPSLRE